MRRRNVASLSLGPALLLALAMTACSHPGFVNAPIGRQDDLPVQLERRGATGHLRVDRPACVAVLTVAVDWQGTRAWNLPEYGPVLGPFRAVYPLQADQTRCVEAGTHRFPLQRTTTRRIPPKTCLRGDVPALDGCHPPGYQRITAAWDPTDGPHTPGAATLFVASDMPVDPFTLAYEMSVRLLASPELQERLARALLDGEHAVLARMIEELVADVPGSPLWAGVVRVRNAG